MKFTSVFLLAATLNNALAFAAVANEVTYHKPYDCTYDSTKNGVVSHQHCMCDGKGHMRVETETNGQTNLMLADYTDKSLIVTYQLHGKNVFQKSHNDSPDYVPTAEQYKKWTPLGAKVVNGYACHGYEKSYPSGQKQTDWVADDTEAIVLSEAHGVQDSVLELKSYSQKAPTFSMELPPGFVEQKLPSF